MIDVSAAGSAFVIWCKRGKLPIRMDPLNRANLDSGATKEVSGRIFILLL